MTDARIKLTNTMLDKSIIDANKTVQSFLLEDFGMDYADKFFTEQFYNSEKAMAMEHVYLYQSTHQEKKPVPTDDPCDDWSDTPLPKRNTK